MATEVLLYGGYAVSFKITNFAGVGTTFNLSPSLLSLSTVAWIVILNVINYILFRKIYYVGIEEGRII